MRDILDKETLEALEINSMESLIDYLLGEDSTAVMPGELQALSQINHVPLPVLVKLAKEMGLSIALRDKHHEGRGFHSNNHDRFSEKNGMITGCSIGDSSRFMVAAHQPTMGKK